MKTKTILSIALIALLPITANATGPAAYSGNSPTVATASAPYQTVTPEAHADEHIASTQYVIGAYNDAIAAVNKVNSDKQGKLMNMKSTPQPISNNVISSNVSGVSADIGRALADQGANGASDEFAAMVADMESEIGTDLDNTLPTTKAVYNLIKGAGSYIGNQIDQKQDKLITSDGDDVATTLAPTGEPIKIMRLYQSNAILTDAGSAGDFDNQLILATDVMDMVGALRVPIYTTWDTNATIKVDLAVASAQ